MTSRRIQFRAPEIVFEHAPQRPIGGHVPVVEKRFVVVEYEIPVVAEGVRQRGRENDPTDRSREGQVGHRQMAIPFLYGTVDIEFRKWKLGLRAVRAFREHGAAMSRRVEDFDVHWSPYGAVAD